jgi:hypothetical protein
MKASLWLFTMGLILVCASCWLITVLLLVGPLSVFRYSQLPGFSRLMFAQRAWLLFYTLPWVVCSTFLSLRKNISPGAVLIFASSVFIASILVMASVVVATLLPYINNID